MKRYVLITGAYGGMGKAAVRKLKDNGFSVFALDKSVGEAEDGVVPIKSDIADENSVKDAFDKIREYTEELFAVIHFAGIYMLDSLVEIENSDFERIFKINLGGAFLVNKTFLPLMKSGSRIVMITSELAPLDPLPFTGIYALTKSALDKYAYSLRMELQLKNINVSVLRAGAVSTGMLRVSTDALDSFCEKTSLYTCNAERFKRIVDGVEARNIPPSRIAKKVFCILNKKYPRFAYSINRNPLLLTLNVLPKSIQLRIIKQVLKSEEG
ncbi:MAG: SDR family NAD(P)-dependent oxidoreductase [Ruminococcaceae bacterium]|nr:SDR family NAD(P)-dependent oxidoreductase [Oscillospiraceae bacterium]